MNIKSLKKCYLTIRFLLKPKKTKTQKQKKERKREALAVTWLMMANFPSH
uniref:Uncharacterized protein n=1 Tax=Arundo donax TaxID=35708 RepID=A0A0A9E1T8_ARUDO